MGLKINNATICELLEIKNTTEDKDLSYYIDMALCHIDRLSSKIYKFNIFNKIKIILINIKLKNILRFTNYN